MSRKLHIRLACSFALALAALAGQGSHLAYAHQPAQAPIVENASQVSEPPPPPHDPKKKNDGDACKDKSECQPHHSCTKVGDTSVCKAPPPRRLPPGAVT